MDKVAVAALAGSANFPFDTSVGPIQFQLLDNTGAAVQTQSIPADALGTASTVTFSGIGAGTYTVAATRQDATGKALAPAVVSDPFTVAGPAPITITIPVSVTVSDVAAPSTSA